MNVMSSQFNFTFDTRNDRSRSYRIITSLYQLANKMKSIRVIIRSTRNGDRLHRFAIVRSSVQLRAAIFYQARAKRISAMFNFPVLFLGVTWIVDRRNRVNTPFFRSSGCSRTSKISSYLARTIRTICPPLRFKFRPT